MPMFVISLLNFIPGYKAFLGIEKKIPKKRVGNKVPIEMRTNSNVVTYYNPYFYGS